MFYFFISHNIGLKEIPKLEDLNSGVIATRSLQLLINKTKTYYYTFILLYLYKNFYTKLFNPLNITSQVT